MREAFHCAVPSFLLSLVQFFFFSWCVGFSCVFVLLGGPVSLSPPLSVLSLAHLHSRSNYSVHELACISIPSHVSHPIIQINFSSFVSNWLHFLLHACSSMYVVSSSDPFLSFVHSFFCFIIHSRSVSCFINPSCLSLNLAYVLLFYRDHSPVPVCLQYALSDSSCVLNQASSCVCCAWVLRPSAYVP